MSSHPGYNLEDLVQEIYVQSLSYDEGRYVLALWEPFRERCEELLSSYDEERNGSWRDHRNAVFDFLPDPFEGPQRTMSMIQQEMGVRQEHNRVTVIFKKIFDLLGDGRTRTPEVVDEARDLAGREVLTWKSY